METPPFSLLPMHAHVDQKGSLKLYRSIEMPYKGLVWVLSAPSDALMARCN